MPEKWLPADTPAMLFAKIVAKKALLNDRVDVQIQNPQNSPRVVEPDYAPTLAHLMLPRDAPHSPSMHLAPGGSHRA